jgi:hypothetical protein
MSRRTTFLPNVFAMPRTFNRGVAVVRIVSTALELVVTDMMGS